jgi:hypothetical protein
VADTRNTGVPEPKQVMCPKNRADDTAGVPRTSDAMRRPLPRTRPEHHKSGMRSYHECGMLRYTGIAEPKQVNCWKGIDSNKASIAKMTVPEQWVAITKGVGCIEATMAS